MAPTTRFSRTDNKGREIKRPPTRLGRFLVAMRKSIGARALSLDAHPNFIDKITSTGLSSLSRRDAADWVLDITKTTVSEETIRRIENGQDIKTPTAPLIRNLCTAYGLSKSVADLVAADPNLNTAPGANPHLLAKWRMANLAVGELGPAALNGTRVGEYVTSWVEVEKGSTGGFHDSEVKIVLDNIEVSPPAVFRKLASEVSEQNIRRKANGVRGWSDNESLALAAITNEIADDEEERRSITLHLEKSWYRYVVVAKESGAAFRWDALQEATSPLRPVSFLASGIGICINVIVFDGQGNRWVVLGQRSDDETFRKGEFDVAVVEGLRPSADVHDGKISLFAAAHRALDEELGLSHAIRGKSIEDNVRRLVIFEIGCDLEYYQWNFLAFAELNLSFEELYAGWQKAKDRNENRSLHIVPFDEARLSAIFTSRPVWSSGMACALRTFDYI